MNKNIVSGRSTTSNISPRPVRRDELPLSPPVAAGSGTPPQKSFVSTSHVLLDKRATSLQGDSDDLASLSLKNLSAGQGGARTISSKLALPTEEFLLELQRVMHLMDRMRSISDLAALHHSVYGSPLLKSPTVACGNVYILDRKDHEGLVISREIACLLGVRVLGVDVTLQEAGVSSEDVSALEEALRHRERMASWVRDERPKWVLIGAPIEMVLIARSNFIGWAGRRDM
ncbi:hypothetical protein PIN31115_04525 [Pandoraea iniqua]|uniref:Uncharacterized protein n=1 Tax=Pandoraea iniqua TaxID=2508288 RepID=A0A5E4YJ13_9BURK|nr:hypothetical protein [Pandoraea iniqua]VVE48482.1 hypothetical protein PIN31115_04525 [Pandoraea iniqua]